MGRDFFPQVDAGQFRLHVRAAPGLRLESTKVVFSRVEEEFRKVIPESEIELILDNIGRPAESFNFAFGDGATIGTFDGEILVALKEGEHGPTEEYIRELRRELPRKFPGTDLLLSARGHRQPDSELRPAGADRHAGGGVRSAATSTSRARFATRLRGVPGVVDAHVHQVMNGPELHLEVDRTRAARVRADAAGRRQQPVRLAGFERSGAAELLARSARWASPTRSPPRRRNTGSIRSRRCENTPIAVRTGGRAAAAEQRRLGRATASRRWSRITATCSRCSTSTPTCRTATSAAWPAKIEDIVQGFRKQLAPGSEIVVRGQVESMQEAFTRLGIGLAFAAVLVYLLMVVNFQSWIDPFIIITALPGAFTGIVWILFLTQTTFSVPSLMGAIMSIGVATANSILLVTFANERMELGRTALQAAVEAGCTRLRPDLHDRPGDDHRHAADGAGLRRRRRAECAAGARRDRRAGGGDIRHAVLCAADVQRPSLAKEPRRRRTSRDTYIQSESATGTVKTRSGNPRSPERRLLLALLDLRRRLAAHGTQSRSCRHRQGGGVSLPSVLVTQGEERVGQRRNCCFPGIRRPSTSLPFMRGPTAMCGSAWWISARW